MLPVFLSLKATMSRTIATCIFPVLKLAFAAVLTFFITSPTVGQSSQKADNPTTVAPPAVNDGDSGPTTYNPVIGKPHPDFLLPNIDTKKPTRLSDYRGKKVLLVHFASW